MQLVWSTDGTGWLVTEQGWAGLPSPQVYSLFYRVINSNQANSPFVNSVAPDSFLRAEVDIMAAQQRLIAIGVQTSTQIDPVKLASAISDALGTTVSALLPPELMAKLDQIQQGVAGITLTPADFNVQANVDPVALAAAFDAAVPRVAAAIVKKQGELLSGVAAS